MISATRYHDFSCGHRVVGHESKCAHLHGHNYRVHFTVYPVAGLDTVGRVLDFSVIKEKLCTWLEREWDHRMVLWDQDPMAFTLRALDPHGVVTVPFNPTAENMAEYLIGVVGPEQLRDTLCFLGTVTVDETRKCSASAHRTPIDITSWKSKTREFR